MGPPIAASLLSVMPVLVLFLLARRFIVDALAPGLGKKAEGAKQGP